jgi:hypothetical protein
MDGLKIGMEYVSSYGLIGDVENVLVNQEFELCFTNICADWPNETREMHWPARSVTKALREQGSGANIFRTCGDLQTCRMMGIC